ncbi:MAG: hydroxyisourate hydrolase [Janthinobacterium lividum]
MTSLSTHVLDTTTGTPAAGVGLVLTAEDGRVLTSALTDEDGRARLADSLLPGTYRLTFATGEFFAAAGTEVFYPEAVVAFVVRPERDHLHVPLLLSPFAYSTYRGS